MGEVVEGVLSETLLDALASDLGIDPKDMRKHPFFRVIKGRVLLTYPLKVSTPGVWKFQTPIVFSQLNPSGYYTVMDDTENVRILMIVLYHNDTTARNITVKITLNGEVITGQPYVTQAEVTYNYLTAITKSSLGLTGTATVTRLDLEGSLVKIEVLADTLLAGKTVDVYVVYERLE